MALTTNQKALVSAAMQQPTLGAALVVAGIEKSPADADARAAVGQVWYNWRDDHPDLLPLDVYACVKGALNGLKDDTILPDWYEGPTIQTVEKVDVSLEDALDHVAKFDKGAADVLADAAHRAQDAAPDYAKDFWSRFSKHAWRGAKKFIQLIGEGAGQAVKGLTEGLGWQGILFVGGLVAIYAFSKSGGRPVHENPRFLGPLR